MASRCGITLKHPGMVLESVALAISPDTRQQWSFPAKKIAVSEFQEDALVSHVISMMNQLMAQQGRSARFYWIKPAASSVWWLNFEGHIQSRITILVGLSGAEPWAGKLDIVGWASSAGAPMMLDHVAVPVSYSAPVSLSKRTGLKAPKQRSRTSSHPAAFEGCVPADWRYNEAAAEPDPWWRQTAWKDLAGHWWTSMATMPEFEPRANRYVPEGQLWKMSPRFNPKARFLFTNQAAYPVGLSNFA